MMPCGFGQMISKISKNTICICMSKKPKNFALVSKFLLFLCPVFFFLTDMQDSNMYIKACRQGMDTETAWPMPLNEA